MKKTIFLLLLAVSFVACKPKQTVVSNKIDNKSEVGMKGNWTITSVTYPGSEYFKMTAFDIADSKCFVGSTWKFISNNNKGDMALTNSSCTAYSSGLTWYVNKDGNFVFKFLNDTKAKKVIDGYILRVANQSADSFQLLQAMNVGGKNVDVVYQFQKAN